MTAEDAIGRTVVVTGATRGIGFETARALARRGAAVVITGRDGARLDAARRALDREARTPVRAYLAEFSSVAAVAALADALGCDLPRIHVLINNAGGVQARRQVTADGCEATFATNHLAPFVLTTRLMDRLRASAPARVVTVASVGHYQGTMDFDDLQYARGYGILRAYTRSKLANVLFARELARRMAGTGVTSNAVHPGSVETNIWTGAPWWTKPLIALWLRRGFISAIDGAAPVVHLATAPELAGVTGRYFDRDCEAEPSALAQDDAIAARLWNESERLAAEALGR